MRPPRAVYRVALRGRKVLRMATHVTTNTTSTRDSAAPTVAASSLDILAPIGRVLIGLLFVMFGTGHFSPMMVGYAAQAGVPLAGFLVPFSGVLAIVGGLSVALGYRARLGGLLLALFLVPITFAMHAYWKETDAMAAMTQRIMFFKNLGLLGAALLLVQRGAGPYSLDARRASRG